MVTRSDYRPPRLKQRSVFGTDFDAPTWTAAAACAALPAEEMDSIFFPLASGHSPCKQALTVCATCPVLRECAEWTLQDDAIRGISAIYGIQGGMSPITRKIRHPSAPAVCLHCGKVARKSRVGFTGGFICQPCRSKPANKRKGARSA